MSTVEGIRASMNDGIAFDAFFRVEHRRLVALATILCGDRETGCDIAQEALIRTYADWDNVANLDRPAAWTRRVVVNLTRDYGRHRAVLRRRLPEVARQHDLSGAITDRPHDSEFWGAVATLPDRQRTAVALFYVGDRSVSEVAEAMGVREGSVKTTLHQARNNLRQLLSEDK